MCSDKTLVNKYVLDSSVHNISISPTILQDIQWCETLKSMTMRKTAKDNVSVTVSIVNRKCVFCD